MVAPYLGKPGAVQALPSPNGPVDGPESLGDVTHALLGGGVAVTRRATPKRTWSLSYIATPDNGVDALLRAFYLGVFGTAPYVFVDPSVRNVLGLDVSCCGARSFAAPGWVAGSGTLTVDSSQTSPVAGSAVLKWASPTGSTRLRPGKVAGTADVKTAPVYLPGEPVTASVWAKASGAGAEVRLDGFDASGALLASSSAVSVPTTWTRLTVTLAAGSTTLGASVFVLPTINATSSPPSNLWIAGAQLEYAATASAWDLGFGSPRVAITAGPGRSSWMPGYSDSTLQLAEV
jgi:hypothetical protein